MATRLFLGNDRLLPDAIASRLAQLKPEKLPDFSRILLVLPGSVARRNVQRSLLEFAGHGVLLPQILTPHLLLHYGEKESHTPSLLESDILWAKALSKAAEEAEKYSLVFPGGKLPGDKFPVAGAMHNLRHELTAGGFSIGDAADKLGTRGRQLAALERLYCRELAHCGYDDPLECDRRAAASTGNFRDIDRIILAGIPDLPRMLKEKLAAIECEYPDMVEIWIGDSPENEAYYDQWGVPVAELWEKKAFNAPLENLHLAANPVDAARRAMNLAAPEGKFLPEDCAIVLADPSLYPDFAVEFSRIKDAGGNKLTIIDPSGVPFSRLRLWKLLHKLLDLLKNADDYLYASELIRQRDFALYLVKKPELIRQLLEKLDDFQQNYQPDNFYTAWNFAEDIPQLKYALGQVRYWLEQFNKLPVAEFLKKFCTAVYFDAGDIGREDIEGVRFDTECTFFTGKLQEFAGLSRAVTAGISKEDLLENFLRRCCEAQLAERIPEKSVAFEGRLEMPFLKQKRIIFCGMNEKFFPDKIDITPFLTDTLRREIGIRSNRETLVRSLCHLTGIAASRRSGDVHLIVLRQDKDKSVLRPSALLFSGDDLAEADLLGRSSKLFRDPKVLKLPEPVSENRAFYMHLTPDHRWENGKLRLSVTDLDEYLRSPFSFYWHRVLKCENIDYELCEPDPRGLGIFCHRAFELLGSESFTTAEKLQEKLLICLEQAFRESFGELPAMVKLAFDNISQRLRYVSGKIFAVRQEGYEVIANEYRFGGKENSSLAFGGALFRGSIDLIEYNRLTNTLRISDIKTGRVENVVKEHCRISSGQIVFSRMQLPLYAVLLRNDPAFIEKYGIDPRECRLECAYIVLPQSVTDTDIQLWDADELAAVLPAAEERIHELIGEISEMTAGKIYDDPVKITGDFFRPNAAAVVRGVDWQTEEEEEDDSYGEPPEVAHIPAENIRMFPVLPDISRAGSTRCCDCPAAVNGECHCCHGDCSSCKSFNGFKSFSIITASAGTGKTYALASRFIQLLSFGVKPENILAITFTRKAAGEIFDRIVRRMYDFIDESHKPENCCSRIPRDKALSLLRDLLGSHKELQISTIDSFFMRLLQSFAPEMGIWGTMNMVEEGDDRLLRKTLRKWIFSVSQDELNALRELLKDANSSELQSFHSSLQKILSSVYSFYLLDLCHAPDGSLPQISAAPWHPTADDVMTDDLDAVKQILLDEADSLSENADRKSEVFARRLKDLANGLDKSREGFFFGRLSDDTKALFSALFDYNPDNWFDAGGAMPLQYIGKKTLSEPLSMALIRSYRHIRALSFMQMRNKTQAIFALISRFDRIYSSQVRNTGNLTFKDLPALLLSMDPETRDLMLGPQDHSLEFRLDTQLSHYMFDEFQDTSDAQFMAFDPLLKELFSTAGGDEFRSFFCVGDIKQSIYQWRGGNPELFNYVAGQLRGLQEKLGYDTGDTLIKSYRSSQVILNTVNAVFADEPEKMPYFNAALRLMNYLPHISARPDLSGFAAVLEVKALPRTSQNIPAKAVAIANILNDIQPFRRRLTVGILVQTNKNAALIAEELRKLTDLPVSIDGKISPQDSFAFQVFRQLLILAEHPGDVQARKILDSLSFSLPDEEKPAVTGMEMLRQKMNFPGDMPLDEAVREEIFYRGLGGFAARFTESFGRECTDFDRRNLEIMQNVAENFNGTIGEFIRQIETIGEAGRSLDNTIQLMTYHKSKGLEFDIVFLPDTGNQKGNHALLTPDSEIFDYSGSSYADGMKHAQWVSYLPPEVIAKSIRPYRENIEKRDISDAFAKCCNLYVAMTRAKRALYMLVSCSKTSSSLAMDKLIQNRLPLYGVNQSGMELDEMVKFACPAVVTFAAGDRLWYAKESVPEKVDDSEIFSLPEVETGEDQIIRASDHGHGGFTANPAKRFEVGGNLLGSAVHQLFERIEFIDAGFDAGSFCAACGVSGDEAELFCDALAPGSPIREELYRPAGECEVWREKSFMIGKGDRKVVSGAFDRVVILKENGSAVKAIIYDYKSDRFKDASGAAVYQSQMTTYRESLAGLLDLPVDAVECRICALRLKEVIRVI